MVLGQFFVDSLNTVAHSHLLDSLHSHTNSLNLTFHVIALTYSHTLTLTYSHTFTLIYSQTDPFTTLESHTHSQTLTLTNSPPYTLLLTHSIL